MTEPMRWLDPESEASGDLRTLLSVGPHAPPPMPRETREESARFVAGLGVVAPLKPWWSRGAVLGGGAGTTSVALLVVALSRGAHTPPQHAPRPHRTRVAPTVTAPPVAAPTAPAPTAPAPTVTAPSAPVVSPVQEPRHREAIASPVIEARDEARLEEARSALERDPTRTLSIARALTAHGRRSLFAEEAEYLAVRALARLARAQEARSAGERFLRRHPSGIYTGAVRRQLENLP